MAQRAAPSCLLAPLLALLLQAPGWAADAAEPALVPPEEYPIYDLVLTSTFLTSRTRLVLIRQLTATRLTPFSKTPPGPGFFQENELFDSPLPTDLVEDFIHKVRVPSRLERKFTLAVPYRLVRGGEEEESVSLAPIPARGVQGPRPGGPPPVVGLLEFSRVGVNRRETRALVYVAIDRPDGTGAGFLVWLYRTGRRWQIGDTEVLWTLGP